MNNEWELLVIADDIEQGDLVCVTDGDTDTTMIFVKYERKLVHLKDSEDRIRKFKAASLEELDGEAFITGKA